MTEALSQSPVPKANFTEQQSCNQRLAILRAFVVSTAPKSTTKTRRITKGFPWVCWWMDRRGGGHGRTK